MPIVKHQDAKNVEPRSQRNRRVRSLLFDWMFTT